MSVDLKVILKDLKRVIGSNIFSQKILMLISIYTFRGSNFPHLMSEGDINVVDCILFRKYRMDFPRGENR